MLRLRKNQFKNWNVPSKASYLGLWVGAVGTLVGLVGLGLAIYFYINPPESPPSNCDEFVRNTNPTLVELVGVKFQKWLGDPERSLTLHYENPSKLRANSFHVEVEYKGNDFGKFQSNAFKEVDMSSIAIDSGKILKIPVIPFSDLQEKTQGTICGVGFSALDLGHPAPKSCDGSNTVDSSMVKVTAYYKTIFREEKKLVSKLWLYHCSGCKTANK